MFRGDSAPVPLRFRDVPARFPGARRGRAKPWRGWGKSGVTVAVGCSGVIPTPSRAVTTLFRNNGSAGCSDSGGALMAGDRHPRRTAANTVANRDHCKAASAVTIRDASQGRQFCNDPFGNCDTRARSRFLPDVARAHEASPRDRSVPERGDCTRGPPRGALVCRSWQTDGTYARGLVHQKRWTKAVVIPRAGGAAGLQLPHLGIGPGDHRARSERPETCRYACYTEGGSRAGGAPTWSPSWR